MTYTLMPILDSYSESYYQARIPHAGLPSARERNVTVERPEFCRSDATSGIERTPRCVVIDYTTATHTHTHSPTYVILLIFCE